MSPQRYPQDKKWIALALLALAQFVVVLDASIVNVALPSIGRDLEFSQDDLSWVVNAYTLLFGGFLLLGGRMADLIGRRRLFVAGLVLFALASLAGGLATSPGWLIAARAVQGLGAALLSPAALSLVTVMFAEGAERNKAMGVWGAVAGSGGAAGVLLGGVLTEYAGWEWVLFVNVPIGIAAAAIAPRLLPESRNEGTRNFDIAGAVSVTAGLSLLVYTLVDANDAGWTLDADARPGRRRARAARRVRRDRAALEGAARAVQHLPQAHDHRARTWSRCSSRWRCSRCSSSSRCTCSRCSATTRSRPGSRTCRWRSGSSCRPASRRGSSTRFGFKPILVAGLVLDRGRARLVRAGRRRRHLPRRHPVPVAARRRRARLRVRVDDDRRGERDDVARGGPRVRADQHVAADRRRARPGDPRLDRELAHRLGSWRTPAAPRRRCPAR